MLSIKKILLNIYIKGFVRCVNKYNILQHELTSHAVPVEKLT